MSQKKKTEPKTLSDTEVQLLNRHAEIMTAVYDRINNVHKKPLHKGQIQVAQDYFIKGRELIMSQWGRNGGKTEGALYIATVAALLTDAFQVMIITPQLKQGKKIYWSRLSYYPPPQYVEARNVSELQMKFLNGSTITIDGCDNYDALRGVKPNLVIYDEFQDHSKEFHLEVMQPNLLGKGSSLIVFGTPPKKRSAYYVEFCENLEKRIKEERETANVTASYHEFPTSINPRISMERLMRIRKELIESGNEVIWMREYEGKRAFGGEDVVFPKWMPVSSGEAGHIRKHAVLLSYLEHDRSKLKWYTICDPGTSTCFAVLFICYNKFTQQIFILDEIYEKDRKRTDSRQMWERIRKKESELYPNSQQTDWIRVYDEAAAWFYNEIAAMHRGQRLNMFPSQKQSSNEETDISKIKMAMAQPGAFCVSDRCYWLRWEIESYVTVFNKNGDAVYQDTNNHLIDCLKYFMQISNWSLMEKAEEVRQNVEDVSQGHRIYSVDNDQWADSIVGDSLYVEPRDIYPEFFN